MLEEQFGRTLQHDLKAMAARIRKWEQQLDSLDPASQDVPTILRVLRATGREYFRLRPIIMAPIDSPGIVKRFEFSWPDSVTAAAEHNGRAACPHGANLPPDPDESGRFSNPSDPQPRHTNDLQQSSCESSGSVTPGGTSYREFPISSQPSEHPATPSTDAGHNSPPANGGRATCPHGADSEISNVRSVASHKEW